MNYRLLNISTEQDWQLAYLAAQHAEAKPVYLTYGSPIGDQRLKVSRKGGNVKVEKLAPKTNTAL